MGGAGEAELLNHVKVSRRIPGWKSSHEIFCHGREYDVDLKVNWLWMDVIENDGCTKYKPANDSLPFSFF